MWENMINKGEYMARKAQIQTQVFVYLLSMIIVGLILLYGYNAVKGFREKQGQISLIELEKKMENSIRAMSSEYGSLKKEALQLPSAYDIICFVDNDYLETTDTYCPGLPLDYEPVVEDAIISGTANIFLVPDGTDNYKIGNIQLDDYEYPDGCLCIEKTGSEAIFRIEGKGDGVDISEWT